ncbi:MAG: Holliday junction resolvase RuvX [Marinilabiliales bacterium]|nr:MAG: Holliday junction resolvase RuvX [Marinilabiliales bacterium]
MGRIMALDVGQKRIGLAVTDPLGIIATGLATVNIAEVFEYLEQYTNEEEVDLFVVGMPVQMNNSPSGAVQFIEPFVRKLKKKFPAIPVRFIDERFTSKIAMQTMIEAGTGKKARRDKATIDRISAVIMLQSFIDSENNLTR